MSSIFWQALKHQRCNQNLLKIYDAKSKGSVISDYDAYLANRRLQLACDLSVVAWFFGWAIASAYFEFGTWFPTLPALIGGTVFFLNCRFNSKSVTPLFKRVVEFEDAVNDFCTILFGSSLETFSSPKKLRTVSWEKLRDIADKGERDCRNLKDAVSLGIHLGVFEGEAEFVMQLAYQHQLQ